MSRRIFRFGSFVRRRNFLCSYAYKSCSIREKFRNLLKMTSLSETYLAYDLKKTIELMQNSNLLDKEKLCSGTEKKNHPPKKMKLQNRKEAEDGVNWRCTTCGTRKGLRQGSFFEVSRLPLTIIFKLIIHWVMQTKYMAVGTMLGCARQSIGDFYHRLRHVAIVDFRKETLKLRGIIEIDESLFAKVNLSI